jgi:hypothetical protein
MAETTNIDVNSESPANLFIVGQIGEIYADYNEGQYSKLISGISVSITTPDNAIHDVGQDYGNVGAVSLDAIFCPYTTQSSHESLPSWGVPDSGASTPTNIELNPFFPLGIAGSNALTYYESGANIAAFNSFTSIGEGTEEDMSPHAQIHDYGTVGSYARGVGLKSPIVLTGYGYGLDGNPVPANTGDTTKFAEDAFTNPSKWKSGPVDLRWDESRKVWSAAGKEGVRHIRFTIDSISDGGTSALCSYDAWDDGYSESDVPGDLNTIAGITPPLGVVEVHDANGCFFDEPADELFDRRGYAHYVKPRNGTARWEVTSLCCRRLQCAEGN